MYYVMYHLQGAFFATHRRNGVLYTSKENGHVCLPFILILDENQQQEIVLAQKITL